MLNILSVQTMASNLLKIGDFNIIIVHWGDGATGTYTQSASNIRLAALELTYLIKILKVHKLKTIELNVKKL